MFKNLKLYKVTSEIVPEYGQSYDRTEEYFLTNKTKKKLRELYGFDNHYYSMDHVEQVYTIEEVKYTTLISK